jgi:hypothetical protein
MSTMNGPSVTSRVEEHGTRGGRGRVTRQSLGIDDDSDDDLLGGLGSDEEDDMAALMQGFVGPSISTENRLSGAGDRSGGGHGAGGRREKKR